MRHQRLAGAIIRHLLCLTFICGWLPQGAAWAATDISLSWSANSEPDLAGYRLRYGSMSGSYPTTIDVGRVTSYRLQDLDSNTIYYFVLVAYDFSGNESAPSTEVSGRPKVVVGAPPAVSSAIEIATSSVFIAQSGRFLIRVGGTNFQPGATVDLGADITVSSSTVSGTTSIQSLILVGQAALGWRPIIVRNPDTGEGRRDGALQVVRTPDIDRSCQIDGYDLNAMARAWNTAPGDATYNSAVDLDGMNGIDGDDLTVLIEYFGQALQICP